MPTPEGNAYRLCCLGILADVDDAENMLRTAQPRGLLQVRSYGFVVPMVLPRLPRFLAHLPDVDLHIEVADEASDRPPELVDCIIRSGKSPATDTDLGMCRIALLEWATCAGPADLRRHGTPASPDGIAGHCMVDPTSSRTGEVLPLEFKPGRSASPCRAAVPDGGRQLRPDGRVRTPRPRADPGAAASS